MANYIKNNTKEFFQYLLIITLIAIAIIVGSISPASAASVHEPCDHEWVVNGEPGNFVISCDHCGEIAE